MGQSDTTVRLLGRTSSINVRKVLWTATEIGLQLDHDDRWATPECRADSPEFLALNPNGLVPVLIDGDMALWESNTICRYLAASCGRTDLLPAGPRERADVERWMDWSAGDLNRAWSYAFMALVRRDPDFAAGAEIERSITAWNRLMTVLDRHLAGAASFACGEGFTLADVTLGLAVHRWRRTPMPRPELDWLERYYCRLQERRPFAELATDQLP